MSEWINAIVFGVAVLAFVLGVSSIVMAVISTKATESGMQEKVEYGFFGAAGLIVCALMGYALA
ncbi:MAG: hypothetical protein P8J70_12915 [Glaciecola sp.]|jgi:hypothetical protein|nr:hypothetical protein [Glaciecola sp.]MDG1815604.1 hypothetical protein [Glaciecola sp.]MDG2100562.1 hypothetical protein [Glaciecola sp.]